MASTATNCGVWFGGAHRLYYDDCSAQFIMETSGKANISATGGVGINVTPTGNAFVSNLGGFFSGTQVPTTGSGIGFGGGATPNLAARNYGTSTNLPLTFQGTALTPLTNDLAALGSASLSWSDLFLASGAVLNAANGDWVATHSTGVLTVGTGDLRITTAGTNAASVVTVGGTQELTNKTLNASVGKGTWTASGTWTLPAFTLGGTVSGGGNQINNVIIGNSTPLAGTFTTLGSGAHTITSASATALTAGSNGATNPAFTVDASTASQAAGFKITGAATGGTVALVATDSGSNTNLTINAKGTGTIAIGGVSTGAVTITPALTLGTALTAPNGGTGAGALTTGSVPFIGASGVYTQDNNNLFWDNTNKRLGIKTSGPTATLTVQSADQTIAQFTGSQSVAMFQLTGSGGNLLFGMSGATAFFQGAANCAYELQSASGLFTSTVKAGGYFAASPTLGVGYTTGAGGTVTQGTNKTTAFTLSKITGQITLAAGSLNAGATAGSTWTNTAIAATDTVVFSHVSGGTIGAYHFNAACGSGTATLNVTNISAGALNEQPVVQFTVVKGVTS
jgi:hypothetical protein